MTDAIRFLLNGEHVEISGLPPTTTLLDWLRYDRRLTGTKEGCAEGDCGACTVAVREIGADGAPVTLPLNACIQLLPMMHGREVVTVEHLTRDGAAHPVQTAMAQGHGSQCGFCTPGFVMSLFAAGENGETPDLPRVDDIIAGNLCRCTGYGPIRRAGVEALGMAQPERGAGDAPARLAAMGASGDFSYEAGGGRFLAPATLDGLAEAIEAHPEATILAGATDVGLWITQRAFRPEVLIYLGRCAELAQIRDEGDALWIGAGATYRAAWARVAALYPGLHEMIRRIGAEQVRAAGTIGGNIANGSPIGDTPPALIAAGATLILRKGAARREMALEAFFLDYGRQDRAPGEFVEGVRLPKPDAPGRLVAYKISKRMDQDISALMGAFDIAVEAGHVTAARIAFGGMAGTPKRAAAAEAALTGAPWTRETVEAAMAAMERDFQPMTDMRASAAYRMTVARNLLLKYFLEREGAPVGLAALDAKVAAE